MTSGLVAPLAEDSLALPPPLQPEVALTAGEEDLDEIVALCDDLRKDGYIGFKLHLYKLLILA